MNNENGYNDSKYLDKLIVDWLNSRKNTARLATPIEDRIDKIDIVVKTKYDKLMNIDTKYIGRQSDSMWYECIKHANSKATHLWYFFKSNGYRETFLIDIECLRRIDPRKRNTYYVLKDSNGKPIKHIPISIDEYLDKKRAGIVKEDLLFDFSIDEIPRNYYHHINE